MKKTNIIMLLVLALSAQLLAGGGHDNGNGGFFIPKNNKGEYIQVDLESEHPFQEKVFEVLSRSRLPEAYKRWIQDDLESVLIYSSNETITHADMESQNQNPGSWFPIYTTDDAVLSAYTYTEPRVVIYFSSVNVWEWRKIKHVIHESIHRLDFFFGQHSQEERFAIGLSQMIIDDGYETVNRRGERVTFQEDNVRIPDEEMKKRYRDVFRRAGVPGYDQLPLGESRHAFEIDIDELTFHPMKTKSRWVWGGYDDGDDREIAHGWPTQLHISLTAQVKTEPFLFDAFIAHPYMTAGVIPSFKHVEDIYEAAVTAALNSVSNTDLRQKVKDLFSEHDFVQNEKYGWFILKSLNSAFIADDLPSRLKWLVAGSLCHDTHYVPEVSSFFCYHQKAVDEMYETILGSFNDAIRQQGDAALLDFQDRLTEGNLKLSVHVEYGMEQYETPFHRAYKKNIIDAERIGHGVKIFVLDEE